MRTRKISFDQLFHALGDPTRRAIVDRLCDGPVSVSQLAKPLGITLTAVGQHLELLEACGLVTTQKVGRVRTCHMGSAGLDVMERWIREHRTEWDRRMDRLGKLIEGGQ